jgi:hypothetical protein
MASEKQKAASRANGAKSRGPVTPDGKLRSARSPLCRSDVERGMLARTVVLDRESRPRFCALMTSLQEELKPETTIENLLTHKMAAAHWRLLRVWGMERSGLSNDVNDAGLPESGKSGVHLNDYEMRFDRQFTRALDQFEKFRAARTQHVQQTKAPAVHE